MLLSGGAVVGTAAAASAAGRSLLFSFYHTAYRKSDGSAYGEDQQIIDQTHITQLLTSVRSAALQVLPPRRLHTATGQHPLPSRRPAPA